MAKTSSTMLPLGVKAPEFKLPNTDGKLLGLDNFPNSKAYLVMFICNHCPFVIHILPSLLELTKTWQNQGITVLAINSNDVESYPEDSPEKMAEQAKRLSFSFPYLFDASQEVARNFQAACTPDFYLFDSEKRLVYRGQMDESRPSSGIPCDGHDLNLAISSLLANKPPLSSQKPSLGCNIKWRAGNEPTYYFSQL